jgi:valyl-tRNA synthetase
MITGFDILFFWVSRMMMLGLELTGDVPFREVHIHGLVRDAEKQKMSKTKGNVIDPLVIMDRFGTDAVRIALLLSAAAGSDIALKEDRMEAGSGFANKIWNASRLLFLNMERSGVHDWTPGKDLNLNAGTLEDAWILDRLNYAIETVNRAMEVHRYHEAAQALWDFIWREFCDWYLEAKKLRFREGSGIDAHWQTTLTVYETALRLLHPLMPFLTEELWQRLIHGGAENVQQPKSISLAPFPLQRIAEPSAEGVQTFDLLRQVVTAARELRADHKLDPKAKLQSTLSRTQFGEEELIVIERLANLKVAQKNQPVSTRQGIIRSTPVFDLQIHATASGDKARIVKEIADLERAIAQKELRLNDPNFNARAPEKVRDKEREAYIAYKAQLEKSRNLLEGLE